MRFLFLLCLFCEAAASPYSCMLRDLESLANCFEVHYAKAWDLEAELAYAKTRVNETLTPEEFREILKDFCRSTNDYHVSLEFYSTESATLPFSIRSAENRAFISQITDPTLPFSPGDEVLAFNNIPIMEAIEQHLETRSHLPTDYRLAEEALTNCYTALLTLAKGSYEVEWSQNNIPPSSFLPPLGKLLWKKGHGSPFLGSLYKVDDKKVGVIRLATYTDYSTELVEDFRQTIAHLQAHSDLLVIDQTGNPGGSPFYMFTLLSMLTTKPLEVPLEQVRLNERLHYYYSNPQESEFPPELHSYPQKAKQEFLEYCRILAAQCTQNQKLSVPLPFLGFSSIAPHRSTRYTKPIIVLIDELDFSCGDLFPAILQDNNRALLFGTRTAGAGGSLIRCEYPNTYGVASVAVTTSLLYRKDGTPIEQTGVTPDISYTITAEDLKHDYCAYREALLKTIGDIHVTHRPASTHRL